MIFFFSAKSHVIFYFIFCTFFFNFYFYFILLYNTVLVLPYIDMNPERERRKEGRKGRKRKLCKVMGILINLIVNISQYHNTKS